MKYTSIIEKFNCILDLTSNTIVYPIFISILGLINILMLLKKIKPKKGIILIIIDYLLLLLYEVINNYKGLVKAFDNIANNFFTNIYFPSIYTYIFILIVITTITIKGILNKEEKSYRITNAICFFIIHFILILIINIISNNNIDVFSKKSLFTNTNLVILLESSINIFLTWLLARTVIYTSSKINESISLKPIKELKPVNNTLIVENINTNVKEENNKKKEYIYTNKEKDLNINDLLFSKQEIKKEETINSDELLDKLINNGLPVIHDSKVLEERNNYTLNDYRIFNKILRDIKEINGSNIININRELELKLTNKYTEEEYNLFKLMLKNYSN